jgi:hypothetical protein
LAASSEPDTVDQLEQFVSELDVLSEEAFDLLEVDRWIGKTGKQEKRSIGHWSLVSPHDERSEEEGALEQIDAEVTAHHELMIGSNVRDENTQGSGPKGGERCEEFREQRFEAYALLLEHYGIREPHPDGIDVIDRG